MSLCCPAQACANTLDGKFVAWSVLNGLPDKIPDIIPVLVTRNAAVNDLPISGTFRGTETTEVGVGKANGGESDTPFSNKAFVLVRKGGASQVIKAKYSVLNYIYNKQSFTVPVDATLEYLKTGAK